jgi:hypothetical protein
MVDAIVTEYQTASSDVDSSVSIANAQIASLPPRTLARLVSALNAAGLDGSGIVGRAVEPYKQQVERVARPLFAALGTLAAGATIGYMNLVLYRQGSPDILAEEPPVVAVKLGVAAVTGCITKATGMYMGRSTGFFAARARRGAQKEL